MDVLEFTVMVLCSLLVTVVLVVLPLPPTAVHRAQNVPLSLFILLKKAVRLEMLECSSREVLHICNVKLGLSHFEGVAFPLRMVGRTWLHVQHTPGIWLLPEAPCAPLGLRCQGEQLRPAEWAAPYLPPGRIQGSGKANAFLFFLVFSQTLLVFQSLLKELTAELWCLHPKEFWWFMDCLLRVALHTNIFINFTFIIVVVIIITFRRTSPR